MKHGDQVKTPNGLGIFFEHTENDLSKAYIVLKDPTENKIYRPLIEPGNPIWECFPCDTFNISDLSVDKTFEQRKQEAREEAIRAQQQRDALLRERMRQFEEAQRRAYEQQSNQSEVGSRT